jgi:hypothetical protein
MAVYEMCHTRRKKLRRSCGKTEKNGEAWLSDDPHIMKLS